MQKKIKEYLVDRSIAKLGSIESPVRLTLQSDNSFVITER